MSWSGVPVFVTGAEGFIGSWLTSRLVDEGAQVVALRRDAPVRSRFAIEGLAERCDVVQGDLLDGDSLARVLNEYDIRAVFHLAAQAIVGHANRSPFATWETNVRGTYTLMEACRIVGLNDPIERIVVASSDKAYGAHDTLPYKEDFPLQPTWPYDVSKAAADLIARSYAATYGAPVAVTRFANVYGGGDFNMSRLVPDTAQALVRGVRPVIRSDGTPERDYIYAPDAAAAYLAVAGSLDRPELFGRAWNAGAGHPVPVIDLVRRLIEVSGKDIEPEIRGEGKQHGEIDRQYLDSTAISQELGWTPEWDLDRGLSETWAWYERHLA